MEFFVPSLLILVLSTLMVFWLIPKFGPVTMLVISIILLTFTVYHHISLFKTEYTQSSWPSFLSAYSPYFILGFLLLFILFFIFSSYGGAAVPVPSINTSAGSVAGSVTGAANSIVESITNTISNATNTIKNTITGNRGANGNRGNGNVRKSFFNVI